MEIAVVDLVISRYPDGIGTDADVGRMTEADHPAVAQDQVEADGSDGQDHESRRQVEKESVVGQVHDDRHQCQHHDDSSVDPTS